MVAHRTHYDVLGVPRDVDAAGLRAAWRDRARRSHPDAGGDTVAFQELAHAYEVLADPVTRAFYDEALALLLPPPKAPPRGGSAAHSNPPWRDDATGERADPDRSTRDSASAGERSSGPESRWYHPYERASGPDRAHRTHYDVLGVPRDVDAAGLRAAWRDRARRSHPDAGGDAAAFQELAHAYEVLADPVTRAFYDEALALLLPPPTAPRGGPAAHSDPPPRGRGARNEDTRPTGSWPDKGDGSGGPEFRWYDPYERAPRTMPFVVFEQHEPIDLVSPEVSRRAQRSRSRADARKAAWQWLGLALLGAWSIVSLIGLLTRLTGG